MQDPDAKWKTEEFARGFLGGIRGAIPGASLQLEVIGKIARLWRPNPKRILDLGCGDGILGRFLLEQFPAAQVVFADFSEPMLDAARMRLEGEERAVIKKADFSDSAWMDAVEIHPPFDLVLSGFAIHHQPDERKKALYSEIHSLLSRGGLFLNLEHVSSLTPPAHVLFDEFFVDYLHEFHSRSGGGVSREEIAAKYYQRPDKGENILAPLDRQCQWLRDIGYEDVDCFFKLFELALFGGRKAGEHPETRR